MGQIGLRKVVFVLAALSALVTSSWSDPTTVSLNFSNNSNKSVWVTAAGSINLGGGPLSVGGDQVDIKIPDGMNSATIAVMDDASGNLAVFPWAQGQTSLVVSPSDFKQIAKVTAHVPGAATGTVNLENVGARSSAPITNEVAIFYGVTPGDLHFTANVNYVDYAADLNVSLTGRSTAAPDVTLQQVVKAGPPVLVIVTVGVAVILVGCFAYLKAKSVKSKN